MGAEGTETLGAGVLEEGAEVPGAVIEGVGIGRMRDTILGAYSFAFLKNSIISTKRQAWEEPTFSQSNSSPCKRVRAITPLTPRFTEVSFIARIGSSTVSKAQTSFRRLSTGISSFLFGNNPTNM
jgi:hypothetical protein